MNATNTHWFSPAPSEDSFSRISLDFGLRAADLHFRELVVPELGRIWFVRQLSWPLAALAIYETIREQGSVSPKATSICHGIESLACKLEYRRSSATSSDRILGRRAFGRDSQFLIMDFQRLCRPANYVRNTHRQTATRAIRVEGGLGFAAGTRFDLLELDPVGRAVAEAFLEQKVGQGGTSLRRWLVGWLRGEKDLPGWSDTLMQALSPEYPSDTERKIVRARILHVSSEACTKRQRLSRAIGMAADLPSIETIVVPRLRADGFKKQADEILAALAFGAMLDRARDVVAVLTSAVEPSRGGVPIAVLERDDEVRKALKVLTVSAGKFVKRAGIAQIAEASSLAFADAVVKARKYSSLLRFLVGQVDQILSLSDGSVIRGALFRVMNDSEGVDPDVGAPSIGSDSTGRTFRIANLHSLLRDARTAGPK